MPEPMTWQQKWFRFLNRGPVFREIAQNAILWLGIAAQLRALRRKKGWTQAHAAKRIGIAWWTLAKLELALAWSPTLTTLKKIAKGYDVALLCRFESWGNLVQQTAITPLDAMRFRRGVRRIPAVEAPLSFDEDMQLAEMRNSPEVSS